MGGLISGDELPTIETTRLRLRWLRPADVPALFAIFSDVEVVRFWSSEPLRDEAEAGRLLAEIHSYFRSGSLYQWGIALRSDDQVIGTCTLSSVTPEHKRAEIGFALGRAHWGRGYATEAVRAVLDYAFDVLDLHRIEGDVDPENARSIRCLEQFGFQREGYARQRYLIGGRLYDSILYGLLKGDYVQVDR